MSGRKVCLCLGTVLFVGLANLTEAALCQFDIGWDSRYTAYVKDSALGTARHAYITPLSATWKSGDDPTLSGLPKNFETYCIDLGNTLHSGQWWESGQFPNPNQPPGNPIWTTGGIYKAAWLYNEYAGDTAHGDATTSGAALQLAIWEVLYEDNASYNVTTGSLYVYGGNNAFNTDGIAGLANTYLGGLPGQDMPIIRGTWWDATTRTRTWSTNQDLIGPAPVPEPATYIAGALLVLPFLTTLAFRRFRG
jgi:hypothetical protein